MAPFTQNINPFNAPDYGSKSRPVDIDQGIKPQGVAQNTILPHGVMQGDESAKYAGEAAAAGIKADAVGNSQYADLFKNIVDTGDFLGKAGVTVVKKDIEDKVYEVADRERQSYTDLLEKIKQGTGVRNVLDSNAQATDEESTPAELTGLPASLEALGSARDSGKISGTYYQSRLLAEAKNLRAQYPGFREYIDQTFSKVTGSNPANAYVQSLVSDINRAATSAASQKNSMLKFIQNNMDSIPNAPAVYQAYQSGQVTDSQVLQMAYPNQKMKADLQMGNLLFQNQKLSLEERQRLAGDQVDRQTAMVVNQATATIASKMGLNTQGDLDKLTTMQANGAIPGPVWAQYGQTIENAITGVRIQMTASADQGGYTQALGGKDKLNARIDEAIKPLIALRDRVYAKDIGGIYDAKMQNEAGNNDMIKQLRNDPKIGPTTQINQAIKDIGGEQNLQHLTMDLLKGNYSDDLKAFKSTLSKNMAAQTNMQTTGVPFTFNDAISNLKTSGVKDGKLNDDILKEVNRITDKNMDPKLRLNYALSAFSDQNRGMISRLQADGYDSKGRPVTGQTAVFQRFTSPEMTKAMHELGKEDPQAWRNYTNWAKDTFNNELMSKEIQQLAKAGPDSGVTVGWDAKNVRFTYKYNDPYGGSLNTPTPFAKWVEGSVNRLNGNLSNMKEITNRTGEDPSAFVLKSIADNAGKEVLQNVNGIPYKLMRDMGLARMNMMQGTQ